MKRLWLMLPLLATFVACDADDPGPTTPLGPSPAATQTAARSADHDGGASDDTLPTSGTAGPDLDGLTAGGPTGQRLPGPQGLRNENITAGGYTLVWSSADRRVRASWTHPTDRTDRARVVGWDVNLRRVEPTQATLNECETPDNHASWSDRCWRGFDADQLEAAFEIGPSSDDHATVAPFERRYRFRVRPRLSVANMRDDKSSRCNNTGTVECGTWSEAYVTVPAEAVRAPQPQPQQSSNDGCADHYSGSQMSVQPICEREAPQSFSSPYRVVIPGSSIYFPEWYKLRYWGGCHSRSYSGYLLYPDSTPQRPLLIGRQGQRVWAGSGGSESARVWFTEPDDPGYDGPAPPGPVQFTVSPTAVNGPPYKLGRLCTADEIEARPK